MAYDKQKVIDIALAEVNYLEKASNAQLDDPTANAGKKNYTKYARDLDRIGFFNGKKNGYAWCAVWVCWDFVQAYGVEGAKELLFLPSNAANNYAAGCRYARNYFKNKGRLFDSPEPGDQIFFYSKDKKSISHTGLVYKVDSGKVYTVEGNTSGASGVISNGGGVCKKSYSLTYSRLAGFGRPKWGAESPTTAPEAKPEEDNTQKPATAQKAENKAESVVYNMKTLRVGSTGTQVKVLQWLLNHTTDYTSGVVDGIFGTKTVAAVRAFQQAKGLTVDGIVGKKTWEKLLG